jgi:hypothetical protein
MPPEEECTAAITIGRAPIGHEGLHDHRIALAATDDLQRTTLNG